MELNIFCVTHKTEAGVTLLKLITDLLMTHYQNKIKNVTLGQLFGHDRPSFTNFYARYIFLSHLLSDGQFVADMQI